MLTSQVVQTPDLLFDLIWRKQVPLKVSILVWWLLRNRLPTKDNLLLHGILLHTNQHCVAGCADNETAQHLLLSCPFFCSFVGQDSVLVGRSYNRAVWCVSSFLSVCSFNKWIVCLSLLYAAYSDVLCVDYLE